MPLNGKQLQEIQEALLEAYPSVETLRMMVRFELNQNLNVIAGGENLRVLVFNLLSWAEQQERVLQLLDGACNQNSGNEALADVRAKARTWIDVAGAGAASQAAPSSSSGSAAVASSKGSNIATRIGIEWVTIPAGEFMMGSNDHDGAKPIHKVRLPEYRIAKYPVTNVQYQAFVKATSHRAPSYWRNGKIPWDKKKHPVVDVSWQDTMAFCQWAGVCLPTEAQWEKAARGIDGRKYPWGNEAPTKDLCNFGRNVGGTTSVGKYPKGASPYGVLDMAGNVWEWTRSIKKQYPYDASDGRESAEGREVRVFRGGSWRNLPDDVAAVVRVCNYPNYANRYDLGFRVVVCSSPS